MGGPLEKLVHGGGWQNGDDETGDGLNRVFHENLHRMAGSMYGGGST